MTSNHRTAPSNYDALGGKVIQKATWIIPGILVTLLLGLLWAMPAFAADAGSIDFLDAKDGDEIGFVSLKGPAMDDNGIWFQITDSDLDEVKARPKQ